MDKWTKTAAAPEGIDVARVRENVQDAMMSQFETYSWEDMIDDADLTPEEKAWAKEHLSPTIEVLE